MLKLTKTGIGLLTRQYRSVLKKCWAINVGVFGLMGKAAASVAKGAADTIGGALNGYGINVMAYMLSLLDGLLNIKSNAFDEQSAKAPATKLPNTLTGGTFSVFGDENENVMDGYSVMQAFKRGLINSVLNGLGMGKSAPTVAGTFSLFGDENENVMDGLLMSRLFKDKLFLAKTLPSALVSATVLATLALGINIASTTNAYAIIYEPEGQIDVLEGETLDSITSSYSNLTRVYKNNLQIYSGGVLWTGGTVNKISATFTGNTAYNHNEGGAIAVNGSSRSGYIKLIENSSFNQNYSSFAGGAIAIYGSNAKIDSIKNSTFTGNYVNRSELNGGYYNGGAILLYSGAIIGEIINCTFEGNYDQSVSVARGGAIALSTDASNNRITGNVTGSFRNNYAYGTGSYAAMGGAISIAYGNSIDGYISATFDGNYAKSAAGALGGAIHTTNAGTTNIKDSTFTNNYVSGGSASKGGAIASWVAGTIVNFSGTNTFTNNKVNGSLNDIYNEVTININDGTTTLDSGYEGTSDSYLNVSSGATLNLNENNGIIRTQTLGNVTNNGTINLALDVDFNESQSSMGDKYTVTSYSGNDIMITDINILDGLTTVGDHYYPVINSGRLTLSQDLIDRYTGSSVINTWTQAESIAQDTNWSKTYYNQNWQTTADSRLYIWSGRYLDYEYWENDSYTDGTSLGDTLYLVNTASGTRNFNASSATSTYESKSSPGATYGTTNINGVVDESNRSALNLSGYAGFSLDGSDIVNLSNMRLYGANSYTANLASANSKLTLNNTVLDGAQVYGSGMVELTGTNTVNAPLNNTGSTTVVSGTTDFNSTVAGFTNNDTVNVGASNITGAATNNGTLNLKSGTLSNNISGTGTTKVAGGQSVTNSATISSALNNAGTFDNDGILAGNVDNSGTLKTAANAFSTGSSVTNTGTLELEGGNLTTSLLGTGRMKLMSGGTRLLATTPPTTTGRLYFGDSDDYVNGIAATKAEIVSGDQYDIVTAAAVRDYISEYGGGSSIDVDTTFNKTSTNPATSKAIANYLDNNYYRKNKKSEILSRFEGWKKTTFNTSSQNSAKNHKSAFFLSISTLICSIIASNIGIVSTLVLIL